jgi:hypothetical protein
VGKRGSGKGEGLKVGKRGVLRIGKRRGWGKGRVGKG